MTYTYLPTGMNSGGVYDVCYWGVTQMGGIAGNHFNEPYKGTERC